MFIVQNEYLETISCMDNVDYLCVSLCVCVLVGSNGYKGR